MSETRETGRKAAEYRRQVQRSAVSLFALGIFPASSLWAENTSTNPHLVKLFALGALSGGLAFAGSLMIRRLAGVSMSVATAGAGVALIFFWLWSVFSDSLASILPESPVTTILLPLLLALALLLAVWIARRSSSLTVLSWVAAGLVIGAVGQAMWETANRKPPNLVGEFAVPERPASSEKRNIFFVVLDGYARDDVLLSRFGYDNSDFTTSLREHGFQVPRAATANYSMTYASLASAMILGYPIEGGSSLGPDERQALYDVLSGTNPVVDTLRRAGYRYHHVESGWGGTRCGDEVDKCYQAPFLDESVWALLQRSALAGAAKGLFGHSFPFDGLNRLAVLPTVIDEAQTTDDPVFVFAHVLLPHPPALVTADCEIEFVPELDGFNTGAPWLGGEDVQSMRRGAYVEQLKCVNSRISEVLALLGDAEDIVILAADHGTDAGAQLIKPVHKWTAADIDERLSAFLAVRLPDYCEQELGDDLMIVNGLRAVLRCAIDADLPDLPPRHFLVNVEENHPSDVVLEVDLSGR